MDSTQILLYSVVTILTVLLVVLGVQVFFILKEAKRTLDKINKILDDANLISESVARPIVGFSNFLEGVKSFGNLVNMVMNKNGGADTQRDYSEEEPEEPLPHSHIQVLQERGRRFFHKDGKPLTS